MPGAEVYQEASPSFMIFQQGVIEDIRVSRTKRRVGGGIECLLSFDEVSKGELSGIGLKTHAKVAIAVAETSS